MSGVRLLEFALSVSLSAFLVGVYFPSISESDFLMIILGVTSLQVFSFLCFSVCSLIERPLRLLLCTTVLSLEFVGGFGFWPPCSVIIGICTLLFSFIWVSARSNLTWG